MASQLSPRQREILDLVAEGRTSKEIAVALGISQGSAPTIATTVTRNNANPNTTVTTANFAVAANTLLVAYIAADGPDTNPATPANQRQNVNSMNNSGALLTWTRAAQSNAQAGDAEIWCSPLFSSLPLCVSASPR